MPTKRQTAEQIIGLLRMAEVELTQGRMVGEICRWLKVSEATFCRWRVEYGGLEVDQAWPLCMRCDEGGEAKTIPSATRPLEVTAPAGR